MFTKTLIAAAALAATASAQAMSSCWGACFAEYQITSEGQLCCSEAGPIVSSCIAAGCPSANATAYEAWLGEYCWVNEGGSTSATNNTWTAPPKTSTVYSTSAITITSCKPEVTDCPAKPESSTYVVVTTTEVAVSTTEVCPYVIPTPDKPTAYAPLHPGQPGKPTEPAHPEQPGRPTGQAPPSYTHSTPAEPESPSGPTGYPDEPSSPAAPTYPGTLETSVTATYDATPPAYAPSAPYGTGNATAPGVPTGSGNYEGPVQTGNSAANVKIGGAVMLLGAAAALL